MKNKSVIYVAGIMLLIIILSVFYLLKYSSNSIEEGIMNKEWYYYDFATGYYNTFFITKNSLSYNKPSDSNNEYKKCKSYSYNKSNKRLNLDCDKQIDINSIQEHWIILTIDSKNYIFYDNIDDTLNYEFENYYGKTISEYKTEMSRTTDIIKIDFERFVELVKTDEYAKFIFMGNNCTSIDCTLSYEIFEKWISKTENIYYVDISNINSEQLDFINKINSKFSIDKNYYDDIYPKIIITKNSDIIDQYEIACKGFDCSKYYENEF